LSDTALATDACTGVIVGRANADSLRIDVPRLQLRCPADQHAVWASSLRPLVEVSAKSTFVGHATSHIAPFRLAQDTDGKCHGAFLAAGAVIRRLPKPVAPILPPGGYGSHIPPILLAAFNTSRFENSRVADHLELPRSVVVSQPYLDAFLMFSPHPLRRRVPSFPGQPTRGETGKL
jgi:hypothetical protein